MRHLFPMMVLAAGLVAAPAFADEPEATHGEATHGEAAPEATHAEPTAHPMKQPRGAEGHAAEATHAEAGHAEPAHAAADGHGDEHGGGHGGAHAPGCWEGGHSFWADGDGDGIANWNDPDNACIDAVGSFMFPDNDLYLTGPLSFHALNFVVLMAIILFGAGGAIKSMLSRRASAIAYDIEEATTLRDEAQTRFDEVTARLAKLEDEIASIGANAETEAKAEEARLAERATAAAAQIAETAQRQIADEAARARASVKAEAVALAVELAEGIVKQQIGAADQRRLAEQFLGSLDGEA